MRDSNNAERPKRVAPPKSLLTHTEAQGIFDSIDRSDLSGRRDRALISLVFHNHIRTAVALSMNRGDFLEHDGRHYLRLPAHDRANPKFQLLMPCFSETELALTSYLELSDPASDPNGPLLRAFDRKTGGVGAKRLSATEAEIAINRRARSWGFAREISLHEFRVAGVGLIRKQAFTYDL